MRTKKCIWLTGLSGAGKTTLAKSIKEHLDALQEPAAIIDGDALRKGLCSDLGFSAEDRTENIRRAAEMAVFATENGLHAIVSLISPFAKDRKAAGERLGSKFIEVHVDCPIHVCESRDPKGLYAKARAGELKEFTGIDSPYEPPPNPFVRVNTQNKTISECVEYIVKSVI